MTWMISEAMMKDYGSLLYLQEPEAESSAGTCLDGEQSALLSGSRTQQAYLPQDKMTEFSSLSQFGMTYKPLTEDRGDELLMSYLEAFRARTSVRQERAPALTGKSLECGSTWQGSLTRYDRDSSSWKTRQCLLLGGLEEFSETWPKWGLMLDGECWEQTISVANTKENGFGFLPTPIRSDGDGGGICRSKNGKEYNLRDWWANQGLGKKRQQRNPEFLEWVMGWPISWTGLMPAETGKFQLWQQQHSPCFTANKGAA